MTVFITRCWRSASKFLSVLLLVLVSGMVSAGDIRVEQASLVPDDDAYVLDAQFNIDLGPRLEEVVSRGVALYFVLEFELKRPRWYWADEHIAGRIQTFRLSYHALTRQYRLSIGALHQSFASLEEALRVVERVRRWPVVEKPLLHAGETYHAAVRLKFDSSQLPKPFQVTALGNKDWDVSAQALRWSFTLPVAEASR